MAADVIYEEAVPVGTLMASRARYSNDFKYIYAYGSPVVASKNQVVRNGEKDSRVVDRVTGSNPGDMEEKYSDGCEENEYEECRSTEQGKSHANRNKTPPNVLPKSSAHRRFSTGNATWQEAIACDVICDPPPASSRIRETWNERLLKQLLRKQQKKAASDRRQSTTAIEKEEKAKNANQKSADGTDGFTNSESGRNSIGELLSGSISRLFGRLSTAAVARSPGSRQRNRSRRRRRHIFGSGGSATNGEHDNRNGELAKDRARTEAGNAEDDGDDDYFWSENEFDSDFDSDEEDIYANVDELTADSSSNASSLTADCSTSAINHDDQSQHAPSPLPRRPRAQPRPSMSSLISGELNTAQHREGTAASSEDTVNSVCVDNTNESASVTIRSEASEQVNRFETCNSSDDAVSDRARLASEKREESSTPANEGVSVADVIGTEEASETCRQQSTRRDNQSQLQDGGTNVKAKRSSLNHRPVRIIVTKNSGCANGAGAQDDDQNKLSPPIISFPIGRPYEFKNACQFKGRKVASKPAVASRAALHLFPKPVANGNSSNAGRQREVVATGAGNTTTSSKPTKPRVAPSTLKPPPVSAKRFHNGPLASKSVTSPVRSSVGQNPVFSTAAMGSTGGKTLNKDTPSLPPAPHGKNGTLDSYSYVYGRPERPRPPLPTPTSGRTVPDYDSDENDGYLHPTEDTAEYSYDEAVSTLTRTQSNESRGQFTQGDERRDDDDQSGGSSNITEKSSARSQPLPPPPLSQTGSVEGRRPTAPLPQAARSPSVPDSTDPTPSSSSTATSRPDLPPKPAAIGIKVSSQVPSLYADPTMEAEYTEPAVGNSLDDDLQQFLWFFECIDRAESETKLLAVGKDGTFLVRPCQHAGPNKPYALTVLYRATVHHVTIRTTSNGKFALGSEKPDDLIFNSVGELVSFYGNNSLRLTTDKRLSTTERVLLTESPPKS